MAKTKQFTQIVIYDDAENLAARIRVVVNRSGKIIEPSTVMYDSASNSVYRRRADHKQRAVEYLGGKCVKCGLKSEHYVIYDFHHIDPDQKEFNISNLIGHVGWEKLCEELDKCVLVCANCHRIIHDTKGDKHNV